MGAKTRSNYAPGYSMTDEDFNRIFRKEKDADTEPTEQEEGKRRSSDGGVDQETEALSAEEAE